MKRTLTLLLPILIISCLSLTAQAQRPDEVSQSSFEKLPVHFGINATGGHNFDDFQSISFNLSFEYDFAKRFFLIVKYDDTYGLFKDGDSRTWFQNHGLGGGLGVHLFSFGADSPGEKDNESLDLCITAGSVVGKSDWRYVYYDGALRFTPLHRNRTTLSLGYRYYDATSRSLIGNQSNLYLSIGYRF